MRHLNILVFFVIVIAAAATSCGGGSTSPSVTPIPQGPTTVLISGGSSYSSGMSFTPATLTVSPGTTVTWGNNDSIAHTSTADAGLWDSGSIPSGKTFTFKFDTPGTYKYHCSIHGFTGTIVVQ